MTTNKLEQILDEAICIDLNFPHFMLNFPTKELANEAQDALYKFFDKREVALVFEYQEHSAKLSLFDVELGNDIIINVPFCEGEKSSWFDGKTFNQHLKVSIFCGYGKTRDQIGVSTKMADYINGLDDAGIRNIKRFTAKRI
ncbi:hypothetical protein [Paracnuella aquatica]|uniref:hypothetical protein n=1 Tax=Paracnuella aquatica TaxID=2268757 RepID=UPI000DEFE624|nr:hypothetical protein [Paracnuella aquatica]RPD43442.1 hypothetical protein DRJ53_20110 [Paracnuella aquatica]